MPAIKRNRSDEHERRKQKCIQLKICLRCSKPRSPDEGLVCEECLEKRRSKRKKQYTQRESENLCRCGKQRKKDKKLCEDCAQKGRNNATTQRIKHVNAGQCITCGKPPVPGTITCQACIDRATTSTLKRYETNKKQGICPFCGKKLGDKFRCTECHNNHLKRSVEYWHRKRSIIINHYGKICSCCGCATQQFVEIDHINNDGKQHRKETGRHIYDWIIKNNFPDDLQLLCANCNRGYGKFGACPHHQEPRQPKSKKAIQLRRKRLKCIEKYGGKCACCGENNWAFLEFDHINNDGKQHRKEIGRNMIKWLIDNNFPDNIQLLCSNCNKAKGLYGACPHERIKKEAEASLS